MFKKYKSNRYSFDKRKQSYRARHRKKGYGSFSVPFLQKIAGLFSGDRQRAIAILTAIVVVIAAVLVVALAKPAVATAGNTPGSAQNPAAADTGDEGEVVIQDPGETVPDDYNAVSTAAVDDETLAGLTGEDGSVDEATGDISDADLKGAIGVVFDDLSGNKAAILQTIEEASDAAINAGKIGATKFYNSKGDLNQQLQDMRSMINSHAKAIVMCVSDKHTFISMANMAKTAGIPVIAINAPVNEGYAVNIVSDTSAYGQKTADFLKQKLLMGNYLEVAAAKPAELEKQRLNIINAALAANASLKSVGALTPGNKLSSIKTALSPVVKANPQIDALIAGQGMAKNALNAYLSFGTVPKLFAGDATAGAVKLWYQLKTTGVEVEKQLPEPVTSKNAKTTAAPKTEKVTLKAAAGELFCAESLPFGAGGTAYQFALRFGDGKKLKSTASTTYAYSNTFLITDENLAQYYERVKDKPDDYTLNEWMTDADVDAMFE